MVLECCVGADLTWLNMTYVYALPLSEIAKHETIVHDAATVLFSSGSRWLSAMIAFRVSARRRHARCGSRVYLAMAQDGVFFRSMAAIHPKWRTPPSA